MEKSRAFTLAEVLIVVVIIGVVAALVLPGFMQDMAERINSNRQANIAQKITKSVELMAVNGDYKDIYTTEEFVNALSKYLKIAKVCDSEHITDCWPTKTVRIGKGQKYNIEDAKKGTDIHTKNTTNNVGLILADGASLIMTFNPEEGVVTGDGGFVQSKKLLPIGKGKVEYFTYTSNATNAIDFIMDVNGASGPNSEPIGDDYYDIRSFRFASFSTAPCTGGFKIGGKCVIEVGMNYKYLNCQDSSNAQYCTNFVYTYIKDYLAGGKKVCADMNLHLPTVQELGSLNDVHQSNLNFNIYMTSEIASNGTAGYRTGFRGYSTYRYEQAPVICVGE